MDNLITEFWKIKRYSVIKAAMILIDPYSGAEYDSVSYQFFSAVIVLIFMVLCSVEL